MSRVWNEARTRAILLDIEGTTTPLAFVHEVLFPYARKRVEGFLEQHQHATDVRRDIEGLRAERAADAHEGLNPPSWRENSPKEQLESVAAYVRWLMSRDRKSTPLKSLQGKIWEAGYRSGELEGQVYPDVLPAFSRWRRQNKKIGIFSSGSVLAQKLLFETTASGDLTQFITSHFDTTVGPKVAPESYRCIAAALGIEPSEIIFVSDVVAELDAAKACDMQTALCIRPGRPLPAQTKHTVIEDLGGILP